MNHDVGDEDAVGGRRHAAANIRGQVVVGGDADEEQARAQVHLPPPDLEMHMRMPADDVAPAADVQQNGHQQADVPVNPADQVLELTVLGKMRARYFELNNTPQHHELTFRQYLLTYSESGQLRSARSKGPILDIQPRYQPTIPVDDADAIRVEIDNVAYGISVKWCYQTAWLDVPHMRINNTFSGRFGEHWRQNPLAASDPLWWDLIRDLPRVQATIQKAIQVDREHERLRAQARAAEDAAVERAAQRIRAEMGDEGQQEAAADEERLPNNPRQLPAGDLWIHVANNLNEVRRVEAGAAQDLMQVSARVLGLLFNAAEWVRGDARQYAEPDLKARLTRAIQALKNSSASTNERRAVHRQDNEQHDAQAQQNGSGYT